MIYIQSKPKRLQYCWHHLHVFQSEFSNTSIPLKMWIFALINERMKNEFDQIIYNNTIQIDYSKMTVSFINETTFKIKIFSIARLKAAIPVNYSIVYPYNKPCLLVCAMIMQIRSILSMNTIPSIFIHLVCETGRTGFSSLAS